jgi:SAM-dependent methyltransferase
VERLGNGGLARYVPRVSPHFKDHFSATAAGYAAHRPTYPRELVDQLVALCPGTRRALDCGCGTGQLSVLLAERFDEVVATDASAAQVAQATPHERVRYHVALAEQSGLADRSVDLITVAQAAHWLDLEKFYEEARRVARANAGIALITYGGLHVDGAVDEVVQRFYWETVAPYWPPERLQVEDGYRGLPFPFQEVTFPNLAIEVVWRLDDLVGYVKTWSAVSAAEKALGHSPLGQFEGALRECWGDVELRRTVTWQLSLRAGHVNVG